MLGIRPRLHWAARGTVAAVLGAAFVVLGAAPAGAHGPAGAQPTNFSSRVRSVTPPIPGIRVEVRDLGSQLEVRNDTSYDVVILGYSGEPYLRVGPDGVYENRRSPSVFLNRAQTVTAPVPRSYDARADPAWHRVRGGRAVSWHDHRVHWMGTALPPAVHDSPGRRHLVSRWIVTLRYRDSDIAVRGELRWVPGPSAVPRLSLALLVAMLVIALGLTRHWGAVIFVSLGALAVLVTFLIAGDLSATSAGPWSALLANAYSVLGVGVALGALGALLRSRREPADATPLVLVAAVILAVGGGLANVTFLLRSQLPTTLPAPLARTFVAVVLGGSIGVLVTAARKLRRPALLTVPPMPSERAPSQAVSPAAAPPSDLHA